MNTQINDYIKIGWVLHPLSKPDDTKNSPGKRPLMKGWQQLTETPRDIKEKLKQGYNIGLVCGKASNVTVIDIDSNLFLPEIQEGIGINTLTSSRTKGRGHIYYLYNSHLKSVKHHDLGVEILNDGSNAVLPPSKHVSGDTYTWKDEFKKPIEMPAEIEKNLLSLFECKKELINYITQCRPCYRTYWQNKNKVIHGSDTRLFLGSFVSELHEKGARWKHIQMLAKLIYQSGYDAERTRLEYDGWTKSGFKPWTCNKLKEQCSGFVDCDTCPYTLKKQDKKNETKKEDITSERIIPEMELKDILTLQRQENDRHLELSLPEDHFLTQYLKWLSSVCDSYNEYHLLGGLWILSTLTKGRVVLKLKQGDVRPNLWIVLLGASTTSRKSASVDKTRQMYETVTEQTLFNEDYSVEGYLESLADTPTMANVRDEAAGLLAKYHKKYNEGIFELECQLYDGQNVKKVLASNGKKEPRIFEVKNPYITKLYATTPENFTRYMTVDDFLCGYGFRFLYAYPHYERKKMGLMVKTEEDIQAWGQILVRIKTIYKQLNIIREKEFNVEDGVMDYYNKIVSKLEADAEKQNNDMLLSAIGRGNNYILKIAMLIELGKKEMSFCIDMESIATAAKIVIDFFLPTTMDLIDRLEEDIRFNQIEKISSVLRRLGGLATHSKVLHDSKLKSKEFSECIFTMYESNTLDIIKDKNTKKRYYRLLPNEKVNLNSPIPQIPKIPQVPLLSHNSKTQENLENLNKLDKLTDKNQYNMNKSVEQTNEQINNNKVIKNVDVTKDNMGILSTSLNNINSLNSLSTSNGERIREIGEFREFGEFSTLSQVEIVEKLKEKYDKFPRPDSISDMKQLKDVMKLWLVTEFNTDKPERYVQDYCNVRGWL